MAERKFVMNGRKFFTMVLGIMMIVGGVYCMFTPAITYMTLGYILAVSMIVDAVGNIVIWSDEKKAGRANGWHLAGAIISCVFGVVLLCSTAMQLVVDLWIAYIAAWIVVMGILRIVIAVRMKKVRNALDAEILVKRWWLILVIGILMVLAGILSFINPTVLMIAIGVNMGLYILFAGANLVSLATL